MEQDLAQIIALIPANLNSSFNSQQNRKSLNLFMEGIRNSDLSRGSDLSQNGNRSSIEAMRHDNPHLPISELMTDVYQGIPQGFNGGVLSGFRTSLESVKESDDHRRSSDIDMRIEDCAPMTDQTAISNVDGIFEEDESSLGVESESKDNTEQKNEGTDNTDNDLAHYNSTCEPSYEQPINPPKTLAPSMPLHTQEKKKCCNCKKTLCLKLYCECFANNQYCEGCNYLECHNLIAYEEERSKAFAVIAKNNPKGLNRRMSIAEQSEFKVGSGCNCTKTRCKKNYCECYKLGIICGAMCNCEGCRNTKERKKK
jgi:hypothetical protein